MGNPDKFSLNRALAYKGSVGQARESFCAEYAKAKQATIRQLEEKLKAEALSADRAITCGKGCSRCCYLYILASLQECETVVHYLYEHEDALNHFMSAFGEWRERIGKIEDTFKRLNNLQARITLGQASLVERELFRKEDFFYAEQDIPCPFLKDDCCTIYEVRPYACAGVMSVSPPEWCHPANPSHQQMSYVKAEMDLGLDMPYFAPTAGKVEFRSLPIMAYNILENGWEALAQIPGLEKLKREAMNDPAMRRALREATGR